MTRARTPSSAPFRRKEPDSRILTSDCIADHIEAFQSAGGNIEVLGVTQVLTRLEGQPDATTSRPAQPRSGTRR